MSTDQELQRRLAFRVTTDELRRFVHEEFPEIFPALPSSPSPPDQVVYELFRLAGNHGCSAALRVNLQRRWPGIFPDEPEPPTASHRLVRHSSSSLMSQALSVVLLAISQPHRSEAAFERGKIQISQPTMNDTAHVTGQTGDVTSSGMTTDELPQHEPTTDPSSHESSTEHPPDKPTPRPPRPPKPLSTLKDTLEQDLLACVKDGQEWDLEIVVAADLEGRWSTAYALELSAQMNKCVHERLRKMMKTHSSRRYHAGTSVTLTLHLR